MNNSYAIKKASLEDVPEIMTVIRAAVRHMNEGGLYQWDDTYPNTEIITADIAAKTLFKITTGGKIVGIVVLNHESFLDNGALHWEDNSGKFIIVHRLCVHPDHHGKGVAKALMKHAEAYAAKEGYCSIRLDTFSINKTAVGLYDAIGYRRVGVQESQNIEFQLFEKVLIKQK